MSGGPLLMNKGRFFFLIICTITWPCIPLSWSIDKSINLIYILKLPHIRMINFLAILVYINSCTVHVWQSDCTYKKCMHMVMVQWIVSFNLMLIILASYESHAIKYKIIIIKLICKSSMTMLSFKGIKNCGILKKGHIL